MITVFSLMKRRPKAHVSPSRNSRAMAPRAHDLKETDKEMLTNNDMIHRKSESIWNPSDSVAYLSEGYVS